jgi:RNA polymerase sigma-70 factor (ECF subfamily)
MHGEAKILTGVMAQTAAQTAEETLSFDEVFTLHHRTVFRVARGVVSDAALAEDVTQEVFLRLYKHLDSVPSDDLLKAWLIRVTINVARNALRGNSRTTAREDAFFKEGENAFYAAEPELDYERKAQVEEVRRALAKVKEPMRSCLMLKQQGLSYKEIACALSLNETSIGTFVARARKEFLRFYGKIGTKE